MLVKNNNPLLPGYDFGIDLVAGITPINADGELDFYINRPEGMQGYILNLTIEGQGSVFDGEKYFECKPGDLLLFPPKVPHLYGKSDKANKWYHRWIYFHPRELWLQFLMWPHKHNKIGQLHLGFNTEIYYQINLLLISIEKEYLSSGFLAEEISMNLLEQLLLLVYRNFTFEKKIIDSRIMIICDFIKNNLNDTSSIQELSEKVYLSKFRLAHLFKQEMGISIVKWRENRRLDKAKHLLYSSFGSIKSIAKQVGFNDALYFSKKFKQYYGVSPVTFRNSR